MLIPQIIDVIAAVILFYLMGSEDLMHQTLYLLMPLELMTQMCCKKNHSLIKHELLQV